MVQPPTQSRMVNLVLDRMAQNVQPDGSILVRCLSTCQPLLALKSGQVYFDERKPRTDAVVSSNVLTCFYRYNRGKELAATLQYVCGVLSKRSYLQGTRYYTSADCCLGFFGRLLEAAPSDPELQATIRPLLEECVRERVGKYGSALDLAMRIILCDALGVDSGNDLQTLLGLQLPDGSWEAGWMYQYGSTGVRIGNKGLTTALALKAIKSAGQQQKSVDSKRGDLDLTKQAVPPLQEGFLKTWIVGCFGLLGCVGLLLLSRVVGKIMLYLPL
jgi:hypothetical protein